MRRTLTAAVVCALTGCTPSESGPTLWDRACTRSLKTVHESTPEDQRECVDGMATHPPQVSDDMARCILSGPPATAPEAEREAFQTCINAKTREYLEKLDLALAYLHEVGSQLDRLEADGKELPATLSELTAVPTVGPWGHRVVYRRVDEGFDLCIVGPDGKHGTHDDRCRAQPFIYFEF